MTYELIQFIRFLPLGGMLAHPVDCVQNVEATEGERGMLIGRDFVPWSAIIVARAAVTAAEAQTSTLPVPRMQPPPPEKKGGRRA